MNTYGQSRGRNGNYSVNWQLTGRELMTPDEVRMLDNKYALLFIRGERPVMDLKYDILKHPNIALTTDGGAKPYVHGKHRFNYASIQFDRDLLGSDFEETKFEDDNSDYVILTEEDIDMILNPKTQKQNKNTEVIYYDEDEEEFDGSSSKQRRIHYSGKG